MKRAIATVNGRPVRVGSIDERLSERSRAARYAIALEVIKEQIERTPGDDCGREALRLAGHIIRQRHEGMRSVAKRQVAVHADDREYLPQAETISAGGVE